MTIGLIITTIVSVIGTILALIQVSKRPKLEPAPDPVVIVKPEEVEPEIQSPNDIPESTPSTEDPVAQDEFWNSKWARKPIIYNGRTIRPYTNVSGWGVQTRCDVRAFILDNDEVLQEMIIRYNLKGKTDDETVWNTQKLICKGANIGKYPEFKPLQYKSDTVFNQSYEFWQFPFETLQDIAVKWNKWTGEYHLAYEDKIWADTLKDVAVQYERFGDCEDGAILIAALAINAGVPAYKIKVAAGDVSNREYLQNLGYSDDELEDLVSEGGHAYCIYLASDNNWRIIDWCYYEDSDYSPLEKPLAKNGGYGNCYGDTWFTFNNEWAWAQTSLSLEGKIEGRTLESILKNRQKQQ